MKNILTLLLMSFASLVSSQEICDTCDGKVDYLSIRYTGSESNVNLKVIQKEGEVVFNQVISSNENFNIYGVDKKNTLSPNIRLYINGDLKETIHTSCSIPIGAGAVFGDFLIIDGTSRNGGQLCPIGTLPVTLRYFRGLNKSGLHILEWQSEEELGFDYYDIEESSDGRKWQTIGLVEGKGASTYTRRFIPNNGTTYYRLKMVDLNGSVEYSPIISIEARQSFHSKVMNMDNIHFYNILQQRVSKDTPGVLLFNYEGRTYKFLNRFN